MTHPTSQRDTWLSPIQRIILVFVNLGLGVLPSLAFLAWIERNASLPWLGIEMGWPWISGQSWPLAAMIAWNCGLFFIFGALHTFFAQSRVQRILRTWLPILPIQALRTFYLAVTGLSLIALMGLWQNTGIVLWSFPQNPWIVNGLSLALFWGLIVTVGWIIRQIDALEFLGLKQIYSSSLELLRPARTPKLETSGVYGRVRHPIYSVTALALILTPFMTLDRALLVVSMALYLIFAIPVEERKLTALFGQTYEDYRSKVPAILPRLSR